MAGKKEKIENRKLGTLRARTKNLVPPKKGVKNMKTAMVKHKPEQRSTRILSINPYTEEVMKKYALMSTVELNGQVGKSRAAFMKWRAVPVADRAALMAKLATVLRAEKRNYAELITKEMGKPIKEALAEVEKCAWLADYYAANAESVPEARGDQDRGKEELRHVPAPRHRARDHALELPVLAGDPVRQCRRSPQGTWYC